MFSQPTIFSAPPSTIRFVSSTIPGVPSPMPSTVQFCFAASSFNKVAAFISCSITFAAETEAKEKTMYVSGDVYMREAADKDAKAMTVLATGKEITVLGEEGDWYQVKVDDKEGYVVKKYITDSKEEAEAAAKAKQEAEAAAAAQQAAEAAAQQAAEQAAQQAAQQPSQSAGGKTEVSRQAYDDCDGSGHGYYEITYSDGSTAIEEY